MEVIALRAPSGVFDLTDEAGRRLWPSAYSRQALDPYYARAEQINPKPVMDEAAKKVMFGQDANTVTRG